MGGRESAKLSGAAQKAGERCCQVELLVSILTEVMLRCISPDSSVRPSENNGCTCMTQNGAGSGEILLLNSNRLDAIN